MISGHCQTILFVMEDRVTRPVRSLVSLLTGEHGDSQRVGSRVGIGTAHVSGDLELPDKKSRK